MKRKIGKLISLTALASLVLLLATSSWARSIRCGNQLVQVGDPTIELLQRCGEPDLRELLNTDGLIAEKWTYNCGSLRFMRIITLKGGVVRRIELADYGSGPPRCQ
jgi:hypothetical protein